MTTPPKGRGSAPYDDGFDEETGRHVVAALPPFGASSARAGGRAPPRPRAQTNSEYVCTTRALPRVQVTFAENWPW